LNARIAAILVVLLAFLGGAALLLQRQETARRPSNVGALGQRLLKDLKAADIAAIRIIEPKAALTLQRKDEGWVILERDGFPADLAKVREFVLKAIELKVGQSEPVGEKDRARLNLDEPGKKNETAGTLIELNGADGKTLAKLIAGKKYFKREVENPGKAPGDGRFVMRPEDPATVYTVSDPLVQASARSADWIDRNAFKVEKVKVLEVRYPGGESWRIERAADNADWKLLGAKAGEKLEITRANAASYSLGLLELADVAPKDAKGEAEMRGLDKPTLINATTLAGVSYAIKVGRLDQDNYYVAFTSSGDQPREKLLSRYVLLVPKSRLEDTLKPRAELLEKRDTGRK
jgi:Domain of unknown function (DUF4340)